MEGGKKIKGGWIVEKHFGGGGDCQKTLQREKIGEGVRKNLKGCQK